MKAKPILIIVFTLAIGIVLGMLISARIRYQKLKPVRVFFSEEGFRKGFYEAIQPDDKQKATIDEILSKYATNQNEVMADFRKKMDSSMKELWKEVEPVLTKEQLDRVKQMEKRRTEMTRDRRRPNFDSTNFRDRRFQHDSMDFRNRRMPHDTGDFRDRRRMPPPDGRPPFRGPDSSRLQDNKKQVVK